MLLWLGGESHSWPDSWILNAWMMASVFPMAAPHVVVPPVADLSMFFFDVGFYFPERWLIHVGCDGQLNVFTFNVYLPVFLAGTCALELVM